MTYFSTKSACCCQDSLLQRLAIGLMSLLKLPLHALAEAFELTLLEGFFVHHQPVIIIYSVIYIYIPLFNGYQLTHINYHDSIDIRPGDGTVV